MVEIINCHSALNLESNDFTLILKGMNDGGLKSVIWQSRVSFLATAGITVLNKRIIEWIGYNSIRRENSFIYRADLFVEDQDIIYILNDPGRYPNPSRKIEIGIISKNIDAAQKLLKKYVKHFETSLKANIDGRRVRHMQLDWYKSSENGAIDTHVSYYNSFSYPSITDADSQAALRLTDPEARKVLRKISEQDLSKSLDIKGEQKQAVMETVERLISWDLVIPKILIICKKNAAAIAVVQSKEEIMGENAVGLRCPHCSRAFSEELMKESFMISELGKTMTRGSQWMTVLLTSALVASGIPEKSIIWNLTEDSEEVDCVVQFKDQVWIFELKDRNFESGDAHPLTYRAIKFRANKIIVFTTCKVTKEARSVFKDMSRNSRAEESYGIPVYIEGLSVLQSAIDTLVKNETLMYVSKKAKEISYTAGMDFSPIFSNVLGDYLVEFENGREERINIFRL
ncbi:hypothetical protein [Pedobacter psychrodurus]|uniref:hypothetical protein n=1 Tax=Pedobacter psychrodurus TaxID=2530456 RepID=UPI00292D0B80|nr:hypothetical protein [Pedobacter psychrodurus]